MHHDKHIVIMTTDYGDGTQDSESFGPFADVTAARAFIDNIEGAFDGNTTWWITRLSNPRPVVDALALVTH
jgi:hypothetical protein